MLVRDLICNNEFDCNCNYDIYDCSDKNKLWNDGAELIFSTQKIGSEKPPAAILNMRIKYITTDNNSIVIEAAR